ncbi:unnamed protein product [Peronospora effusa]|nr:unnamed protein product [Peronospora effusa]
MTLTVCTVTVDGDVAMYAKGGGPDEDASGGYKQCREKIKVLRSRFDMYASESMEETNGRRVKTMIVTGFLHSFVLPQFCLHSPRPDLVCSCNFVGDADELVTYKECYLLTHLLQILQEHFDVAFCMFNLDGDMSVDNTELCAAND